MDYYEAGRLARKIETLYRELAKAMGAISEAQEVFDLIDFYTDIDENGGLVIKDSELKNHPESVQKAFIKFDQSKNGFYFT